MGLAAGRLNLRFRIEQEARVANGQGGFTTSWSAVATVWGSKRPLRGDETVRESIIRSTAMARVTIRYRADVTTKHRLVEGATIWNIRSVDDPDGRRERLEMLCESGVPT